jgi:two-component system, OmpR family, phosphate regulon response regulator PhoB
MEGLISNRTEYPADPSNVAPQLLQTRSDGYNSYRVLIIDQDTDAVQALGIKLAQAGFTVTSVGSSEDVQDALERDNPHLVMLDWDLPGSITTDLVGRVRLVRRNSTDRTPRLIALSAFSGEQHVASGLEFGLDDYVVKPFSFREVVARVRAVLRPLKTERDEHDYLEFHCIRMDVSEARVTVRDRSVTLRGMEFRLLEFLMRQPERAFYREQMLQRVWGNHVRPDIRTVDVTVQRIRRALAPHGCDAYLQTIRGVGYRISAGSK